MLIAGSQSFWGPYEREDQVSDAVTGFHSRSVNGAWLIAIAAAVGFVITLINYFTPHGPIAQTWGALLVLVSTALMLVAALWIACGALPRWLLVLFDILIVIDVLGTGFCAYMLETQMLLACMVIALIGWIWHIAGDNPRLSRS
jgi:hypothetical protein